MKYLIPLTLALLLSASATFAASHAMGNPYVDTLIKPYLATQQALAGDDVKAAKAGANQLLEALKQVPKEGKPRDATADLSAHAKAIAKATDIEAARTAFRDLSRELTALLEHVGTTQDTSLYIAHCPMAFDNEGARWVQSDPTIANPYYGSMMLSCGSIEKQIGGESSHDAAAPEAGSPTGGHDGHAH